MGFEPGGENEGREFFRSEVWKEKRVKAARPELGTWREPARELRIYKQTDVLVIGGGPAGTAAAIAAARAAPKSLCWSATTTWAASRPAVSLSGSTA